LKQDREQEKPVHAANPARAQILCGRRFAVNPELEEEGYPMGRDPCQGKQTNKSRAELEEAVHVISKKGFVWLLKLRDIGPLPGLCHDNTHRAPPSMTVTSNLSNQIG
jgi:hypothetical protein